MRRILFIFLITSAYGLPAQTVIEKIDANIAAYNKQIEESIDYEEAMPRMTINCTLTKRAIGPVNHLMTFYFDRTDELIEPDDDEGEMEEVHSATLRKVTFTLKSGSYETIHTYYFDEHARLISYQEKNTGSYCYLLTYYYANGQCLKIKEEPIKDEYCETSERNERKVFTEEDRYFISQHLEESGRFKKLLAAYYDVLTW